MVAGCDAGCYYGELSDNVMTVSCYAIDRAMHVIKAKGRVQRLTKRGSNLVKGCELRQGTSMGQTSVLTRAKHGNGVCSEGPVLTTVSLGSSQHSLTINACLHCHAL